MAITVPHLPENAGKKHALVRACALADEVRRRDNLAVLERFTRTSYGTSLSDRDVLDALSEERAERGRRLGLPEGDQ